MAKMKGAIVVDTERCKGLPSEGHCTGQQSESAWLSVCGGSQRGGLCRLCFVRYCLP